MGWGEKAIEIRSIDRGLLNGVFMHKRPNKLKFLTEKNDKVFFASVQSPTNSQGRAYDSPTHFESFFSKQQSIRIEQGLILANYTLWLTPFERPLRPTENIFEEQIESLL